MSCDQSIPFSFDGSVITMFIKGEPHTVHRSSELYDKVRHALKDNISDDEMLLLLNPVVEDEVVASVDACGNKVLGSVKIENGIVTYNGEVVDDAVANRIKTLVSEDLPVDGMLKFVARLYNNVSFRVRKELMSFIDRNGLTVDSDGKIIAYKAVRHDYFDKYTGTISNHVGAEVKMDRQNVDDDFDRHCSSGLHAGDLRYIYWYGNGNDRIVVVKIDPEDVVCIPKDCDCRKMRVCRYVVVGDYNGELKQHVYEADKSVDEMYESDAEYYDDDYEDEDDFWNEFDEDEDEDYDEDMDDDDDSWEVGQVTSSGACCNPSNPCGGSITTANSDVELGVKPSGQRYWNVRGSDGKFTSK